MAWHIVDGLFARFECHREKHLYILAWRDRFIPVIVVVVEFPFVHVYDFGCRAWRVVAGKAQRPPDSHLALPLAAV